MAKKSIIELGKGLKVPKMQFHVKKLIYFISRVFLPGLFYIFWPAAVKKLGFVPMSYGNDIILIETQQLNKSKLNLPFFGIVFSFSQGKKVVHLL